MFKTRLLSGIVLVILAVIVLYFGGLVTGIATLMLSIGGVFELLRISNQHKTVLGIATYLATICYYVLLFLELDKYVTFMLVLFIIMVLSIYVLSYPTYTDKDIMSAVLAFFYAAFLLSYFYKVRVLPDGGALIVMVFVCSWVNDTLAYCAGVTMGKHKMSPKLSPKKSIEGLIGGLLGSTIVGGAYGAFFVNKVYDVKYGIVIFAVAGLLGAAVAVIGDLAASAIKRNNDIKDYSNLIPGHGGILDRFDSIIFTAPIVYFCFSFLLYNF